MSHFSVIVIGENVEKQLAPYDECLAVETVEEDGETYSRNPNAKWDWYVIGGRWTGYFKLKPGARGTIGKQSWMTDAALPGHADIAYKRDIDFEGMRNAAEQREREWLVKIRAALNGITTWTPWTDVPKDDIDVARTTYRTQPAVKALRSIEGHFLMDLDRYMRTDEDLIAEARASAISSFAVVKDGVWYERGKMGWWACVNNEKSADAWNAEFDKLLDELSDDTLLTAVDCHI